jgi:hypothetical protein
MWPDCSCVRQQHRDKGHLIPGYYGHLITRDVHLLQTWTDPSWRRRPSSSRNFPPFMEPVLYALL